MKWEDASPPEPLLLHLLLGDAALEGLAGGTQALPPIPGRQHLKVKVTTATLFKWTKLKNIHQNLSLWLETPLQDELGGKVLF